ncbi:MAG: aminotransferase class I/II-fold pyridoxal phosphate-dependent enzyme [Paludibacteraceae bacterium]|nr:aminotransferase class I/II-fold pyridoxal phosphate-dependent enzyme [Paludibacteraceae bacterium]
MIQFHCDYAEGAHPAILKLLVETNLEQTEGYGKDHYCAEARSLIKKLCGTPDADVHFLVGGTQTNMTVISTILKSYEGVISPDTGHINVHETGAVEHSGHKVLTLPATNGKINAMQLEQMILEQRNDEQHEHMVRPGMVYISFPTEMGTLYTLAELTTISQVCQRFGLPLFIDGARLGYGLCSPKCDVTLQQLAALCDVFYIGATKIGGMFGEAVVITDRRLQDNFRYHIKQNGAMLAKGRLLGLQFLGLLSDDTYWTISKHAVDQAMRIRQAFIDKGYHFYVESFTNQQFPIVAHAKAVELSKKFLFTTWQHLPQGQDVLRFCTSWATKPEDVDTLIANL